MQELKQVKLPNNYILSRTSKEQKVMLKVKLIILTITTTQDQARSEAKAPKIQYRQWLMKLKFQGVSTIFIRLSHMNQQDINQREQDHKVA